MIHGYILTPSRAFVLSSYTDLYARVNYQAAHTYNRPRGPNSPETGAAKFEDSAYVSLTWFLRAALLHEATNGACAPIVT